jgi:hypothetical protein
MSRGTLAFLLLLVAGLVALWLARAKETLQGGPAPGEYALLPGFAAERVREVRVDHLERSFLVRFERDAAGRWFMTDPVSYPAQASLLRALLATLEGARGEPAPEVERAEVGLDPPKVVVECIQVGEGVVEGVGEGAERTLRVELGGLDLDPSLLYARVPGHPNAALGGTDVFRTTRVMSNTLERFPDDYRDRRATPINAQDVISIRRRGMVYLDAEHGHVDLTLDALSGPDGWKRVTQSTISLDPSSMGLLARSAAELDVVRFVDDSPTDFARFGLDEPTFTVEIEPLSGAPVELLFGHPPHERGEHPDEHPVSELQWFCMRKGYAHVWEVEARAVERLALPAELFYDQIVVRALREDIQRLELEADGQRRVLQREARGWSVGLDAIEGKTGEGKTGEGKPAEGKTGDGEGDAEARHPADTDAVEEVLGLLERAQLGEHFPLVPFEPRDPPAGFTIVLASGARLGGRLGSPLRDPASGAEGLQYLRDGDAVVAQIDASLLEVCRRPIESFRSTKVIQLQESLVRAVELTHVAKAKRYVYVNSGNNQWTPEGETLRAPSAFEQSLDGLLNLGAKRWLAPDTAGEEALVVRLVLLLSEPVELRFVQLSDGGWACRTADGQLAEVEGGLVQRLLGLF